MYKIQSTKRILLKILLALIIIYVVMFVFDTIPCINNCLMQFRARIPIKLKLQDKMGDMVGAYGIVWTVTVGFMIFTVQNGYGHILGLKISDILHILLKSYQIIIVSVYLLLKFLLCILAYVFFLRFTFMWTMVECFICFAVTIWFFIKVADLEGTKSLLINDIHNNMKILEKNDKDKKKKEQPNWKIIKCTKNMSYNNSEETEALVELLTEFVKQMINLDHYPDKITVEILYNEMKVLKLIIGNIIFTNEGKLHIEYIIKQCIENLADELSGKQRSFRMFLLLESILNIIGEHSEEKLIGEILDMLDPQTAQELLRSLLFYVEFVKQRMGGGAWSDVYFLKLFSQKKKLGWEDAGRLCGWRVIYLEYEILRLEGKIKWELNSDEQLISEYLNMMSAIEEEEKLICPSTKNI